MVGHCTFSEKGVNCFVILTEFMEKGSLADLLVKEINLSNQKRFSIAANIAAGMARIHKIGFIHRDIRPENIFINSDYVAKIGDMGIAKIYESNELHTIGLGCQFYMPPEFYTQKYSLKLDVFTFGLTLNQLFKGKHKLVSNKIEIIKKCELVWETFVCKMIDDDPDNRPTSKVIDEKLEFIERFIEETNKNSSIIQDSIFKLHFLSALNSYKDEEFKEENELKKREEFE
jgi:serine/threonine protein kinase